LTQALILEDRFRKISQKVAFEAFAFVDFREKSNSFITFRGFP
jgi:hypothetical protein